MIAIYDFHLFPWALGDVLSWNIQTALAGEKTDIYLCADPNKKPFIYQGPSLTKYNIFLRMNDILGAFAAHPNLGNIRIYREQEQLVKDVKDEEYKYIINASPEEKLSYFQNKIFSYKPINAHFKAKGSVPLLARSMGTIADVDDLLLGWGGRVVAIHPRLRRLDRDMQGENSYYRDSDIEQWIYFLRYASEEYPDIKFVVLGRLQEKPLKLLNLPNVHSIRPLGMGLGHELTLIQRCDLFMGTSSGFAVAANFSNTPYYVTGATDQTYEGYSIPKGTNLPWATNRQFITGKEDTSALLTMLHDGLKGVESRRQLYRPGRYFLGVDQIAKEDKQLKSAAWRQKWIMPLKRTKRLIYGVCRKLLTKSKSMLMRA